MTCEIIQFSTAARVSPKRGKAIMRPAGTSHPACDDVELSTTCKNSRLRQMRDEAWNRARHTTR